MLDGEIAVTLNRPRNPSDYYTASLDAAMTLVPEGWQWSRYATDEMFYLISPFGTVTGWNAVSDALALTAAALRALAAQQETSRVA